MYPQGKNGDFTVSNEVEIIDEYAFWWSCKLNKIKISSTVKEIKRFAFQHSSNLSEVELDAEKTETYIFENCYKLEKLDIGKNVKTIGSNIFGYCSKLAEASYLGTKEEWNNINKNGWNNTSAIKIVNCTNGSINI